MEFAGLLSLSASVLKLVAPKHQHNPIAANDKPTIAPTPPPLSHWPISAYPAPYPAPYAGPMDCMHVDVPLRSSVQRLEPLSINMPICTTIHMSTHICIHVYGFLVLAFLSQTGINIDPKPVPLNFQKHEMDSHTSASYFCEKPAASDFCPRFFRVQAADVARNKESSGFAGNCP